MSFSKRNTTRPGEFRWKHLSDWRSFKSREPLSSTNLCWKKCPSKVYVPSETRADWIRICSRRSSNCNAITTTVPGILRSKTFPGLASVTTRLKKSCSSPPSVRSNTSYLPPVPCPPLRFRSIRSDRRKWQNLCRSGATEGSEAKQFRQRDKNNEKSWIYEIHSSYLRRDHGTSAVFQPNVNPGHLEVFDEDPAKISLQWK